MNDGPDEVIDSFHRCRQNGEMFETFYKILLDKSPEIPPKFARTDFNLQRLVLREALLLMLALRSGCENTKFEIEKLGVTHNRHGYDISPQLYDYWLDALCETVQRHDTEYRPELDALWREAMKPGIDLMKSMY